MTWGISSDDTHSSQCYSASPRSLASRGSEGVAGDLTEGHTSSEVSGHAGPSGSDSVGLRVAAANVCTLKIPFWSFLGSPVAGTPSFNAGGEVQSLVRN